MTMTVTMMMTMTMMMMVLMMIMMMMMMMMMAMNISVIIKALTTNVSFSCLRSTWSGNKSTVITFFTSLLSTIEP